MDEVSSNGLIVLGGLIGLLLLGTVVTTNVGRINNKRMYGTTSQPSSVLYKSNKNKNVKKIKKNKRKTKRRNNR